MQSDVATYFARTNSQDGQHNDLGPQISHRFGIEAKVHGEPMITL